MAFELTKITFVTQRDLQRIYHVSKTTKQAADSTSDEGESCCSYVLLFLAVFALLALFNCVKEAICCLLLSSMLGS